MDQLLFLKNISFAACQDNNANSESLRQFRSTFTPTIMFKLITELEAATKQLAEVNLLHEEKRAILNDLTKKSNPDFIKNEISEHNFSAGRWHWPEIVEKKTQSLEKLLKLTVEDGSVLDEILTSVALESREGAYSAVAAALGVDRRALQAVSLNWEENQDAPPCHITFDELRTKIMLYKQLVQTI